MNCHEEMFLNLLTTMLNFHFVYQLIKLSWIESWNVEAQRMNQKKEKFSANSTMKTLRGRSEFYVALSWFVYGFSYVLEETFYCVSRSIFPLLICLTLSHTLTLNLLASEKYATQTPMDWKAMKKEKVSQTSSRLKLVPKLNMERFSEICILVNTLPTIIRPSHPARKTFLTGSLSVDENFIE